MIRSTPLPRPARAAGALPGARAPARRRGHPGRFAGRSPAGVPVGRCLVVLLVAEEGEAVVGEPGQEPCGTAPLLVADSAGRCCCGARRPSPAPWPASAASRGPRHGRRRAPRRAPPRARPAHPGRSPGPPRGGSRPLPRRRGVASSAGCRSSSAPVSSRRAANRGCTTCDAPAHDRSAPTSGSRRGTACPPRPPRPCSTALRRPSWARRRRGPRPRRAADASRRRRARPPLRPGRPASARRGRRRVGGEVVRAQALGGGRRAQREGQGAPPGVSGCGARWGLGGLGRWRHLRLQTVGWCSSAAAPRRGRHQPAMCG